MILNLNEELLNIKIKDINTRKPIRFFKISEMTLTRWIKREKKGKLENQKRFIQKS